MSNGNNINLSKGERKGIVFIDSHGLNLVQVPRTENTVVVDQVTRQTTKTGDLKEYFAKYGDVENVSVKFDAVTGNPRGFGFITFASEKTLDAVLKDGPHTVREKQIDPKRAKSRPICKKVFVGGIDASISEEEIRKYFSKYGKVEQIELPFDRTRGKRREFVFIIFEDEAAAEICCREPKQHIGDRDCDVKKAQPQPVAQQQKQKAQASSGYGYGGPERGGGGLRPPRGRGGHHPRGGHSSSYGYGTPSGYPPEAGYGAAPGWEGYGYGYGSSATTPSTGGANGYADYYANYYAGQAYDYARSGASGAYYGYPGYEAAAGTAAPAAAGGDPYPPAPPAYGTEGYPPPPASGGKMVRGKSSAAPSAYHPYPPRTGPPPPPPAHH